MSQQATDIFNLSFVATAAVLAFRGVDVNGVQIATQGARPTAIAKRPAAIGESYEGVAIGTATIEAGAAITKGAEVIMDNVGRVIPASQLAVAAGATAVTSSAANGAILTGSIPPEHIVGVALEAAAGAGSLIEVKLSI